MADTLVLGTSAARRERSNRSSGTNFKGYTMNLIALAFTLIVALDYDVNQDCTIDQVCFGLIDEVNSVIYDIASGTINIDTVQVYNCTQDGIFRDRFEPVMTVTLNGIKVGTLKSFSYDVSTGIITVETNELNFDC